MKILEAYRLVMGVLDELRGEGVAVSARPSRVAREGGDALARLAREYLPPGRLPVELWRHVELTAADPRQVDSICLARRGLDRRGVRFDVGGGASGRRAWELDWSFHVEEGHGDGDDQGRADLAEGLIEDAFGEGTP